MASELRITAEVIDTADGEPVIRVVRGDTVIAVANEEVGQGGNIETHIAKLKARLDSVLGEVGSEMARQFEEQGELQIRIMVQQARKAAEGG